MQSRFGQAKTSSAILRASTGCAARPFREKIPFFFFSVPPVCGMLEGMNGAVAPERIFNHENETENHAERTLHSRIFAGLPHCHNPVRHFR
jgi:hypothetical protein